METPRQGADPWVGRVLQERYRVLERIGRGGMGVVYLAEHVLIRRKVAIKTLHAELAADAELVERFRREALAATAVGNEHIIDVTDMGQLPDGSLFMVLEYLQGREFGAEIDAGGPLPIGRVVRIVNQLCDGLSEVHNAGIVHRDLKPENLLLVPRGDDPDFVKILDFGISKFRQPLHGEAAKMTATGAALGTPYFMAPEQAEGRPDIDQRCDIYAIGAILYYALSGSYPLEAPTLPQLFMRICTEVPADIRNIRPDVPPELALAISRCLSKEPSDRFADCKALKHELSPFATMDTQPQVEFGALANTVPRNSAAASGIRTGKSVPAPPTKPVLPLLVGAVLAVGAAGTWWVRTDRSPEPIPTKNAEKPGVDAPKAVHADSVRVRITTVPIDAQLLLDGLPVANPFDAQLPRAPEPRTLEARRSGYRSVSKRLSLQFPQSVELRLEASAATPGRGATDNGVSPRVPTQAPEVRQRPTRTAGTPRKPTRAESSAQQAEPRQPVEDPPADPPAGRTPSTLRTPGSQVPLPAVIAPPQAPPQTRPAAPEVEPRKRRGLKRVL